MSEAGYHVVAVGPVVVDLYSLDLGRPLEEASRFAAYVGGSAANVAVGAARLGLKAAVVARLGAGPLGDLAIRHLQRAGVDTSFVVRDPELGVGLVVAEVVPGADGRAAYCGCGPEVLSLRAEDLPLGVLASAGAVVVSGTALAAEPARGAAYAALEAAGMAVLNLDWRPVLWRGVGPSERVAAYRRAFEAADVVVGNAEEYTTAAGRGSLHEALEAIRRANPHALQVVTLGGSGSLAYIADGRVVRAGPYRVSQLKGWGGGDGFLAGLLYGLLAGWSLERALRFGNAIGAIAVTQHSSSLHMPTYEEAMEFVRRHGGL